MELLDVDQSELLLTDTELMKNVFEKVKNIVFVYMGFHWNRVKDLLNLHGEKNDW